MKETLRQLRSLQRDIDALEQRVDAATAPDSIALLARGLEGDKAAAAELRALKRGHLAEFLDALAPGIEDEPEPAPTPQPVPAGTAVEQADQSRIIAIDTAKGETIQ